MIQIHETVKQGSREWWDLRLGKPTASRFARIVTPARLEYSKAADGFAAELIAERILGRPLDWGESDNIWTERGIDMETEARMWYEFYKDTEVRQVGFVTRQDGEVGCSPDGLVGDSGLIEIKCRSAKHHARAIMGVDPIADSLQIQGMLWVSAREWCDVIAYNDVLPKKIERVRPDPTVQAALTGHINVFLNRLDEGFKRLQQLGEVIEDDDELTQQLIESVKAGA